jgi:simple sugar transport system ATP-binding protein
MVFQHFSLFEAMTVLENIALGLDQRLSQAELEQRIREVLTRYGLTLDPHRTVSTLSVGERQRIEIVRALLLSPKLLIMDEPTSVLTPQEVTQLFETLRSLAASGCSILYISHKLHEIKALCDTATILRGGRVVGTCVPAEQSSRSMAEMMIGGSLKDIRKAEGKAPGAERFAVEGLSLAGSGDFDVALRDIRFAVRAGEILGIAGVAGNGQNELLLALSGETPGAEAAVRLDGRPVGALGIGDRRRRGLAAVPEERNGHAAVPGFSLADNAVLTARGRKGLVRNGVILASAADGFAREVISAFAVKATGPAAFAGSLSGGNLQKFIMGREVLQVPEVLIVSQPTWGVDAGAAAAIHQALVDLAARGSAIVVISQDLDELLALSDSLAVINEGRLSPKRAVGDISIDEIGMLMGGVHGEAEHGAHVPAAGLGGEASHAH